MINDILIQRRICDKYPSEEYLKSYLQKFGEKSAINKPNGIWTSTEVYTDDGLSSQWEEDGTSQRHYGENNLKRYRLYLNPNTKIFRMTDMGIRFIIEHNLYIDDEYFNHLDIARFKDAGYDGIYFPRYFSYVNDFYHNQDLFTEYPQIMKKLINHLNEYSTESLVTWNWKFDSVEEIR